MIRPLAALVALAIFAVPVLAVDPAMLNLVSPDAKVIAGADVDRVKNTLFGQFLLSQMPTGDPGFQKFLDATGFDPRTDLREILVASPSAEKSPHGLVAVRGTFDEAKIASLAVLGAGGTVSSYQGVKVITGNANGSGMVALLGNGILLAGSADTVKGAIDRQRAGAKLAPDLAARVLSAGSSYDAWFVTAGSPAALARTVPDRQVGGAMQGNVVQAIEHLTGGLRFGTNVELAAEAVTRSDRDATALADVVRFLASMAASNHDPKSGFAQMLESLQLSAEGRTVRLTVSASEQEVEKLIRPQRNQRTKKVVYVK
jgi:hypothetical protein